MPLFKLGRWKEYLRKRLAGWGKEDPQRLGIRGLIIFLFVIALACLQKILSSGTIDVFPEVLLLLGSNAGGTLIANLIETWVDEASAAKKLETLLQSEHRDEVLEGLKNLATNLELFTVAKVSIKESDKVWFEETLEQEINDLGLRRKFGELLENEGVISRSGIISVGNGSQVQVIIGNKNKHISAPKNRDALKDI